jgi:hypothetical protein
VNKIFFPIFDRNRVDSVLFQGFAHEGSAAPTLEKILFSISQQIKSSVLVYPSHLFEHPNYKEILERTHHSELKWQLQISLGAEFFDYQKNLLELRKEEYSESFLGVELAIDRNLNPVHLDQINFLEKNNIPFSFLCVPKSDLQPVSFLKDFPDRWLDRVTLFFPKNLDTFYSNLSNDEIYLLRKKIEEQRPNFPFLMNQHMVEFFFSKEKCAGVSAQYRADPSEESFVRLYPLLGKNPLVRKFTYGIFRNPLLSSTLILPYGFFWVLHDPLTALSMPLRLLRRPMILIYKLFDLSVWIFYRILEIFWLLRHLCIMAYVFSWRTISMAQRLSISLYYLIFPPIISFFKQPLWHLEKWFPTLYPLSIYPFKKIYWFAEFQIQKRLLRDTIEKDA